VLQPGHVARTTW